MTTRDIDESVSTELNRLRESIDNIDAAVVHMLAERFKCTQQVGHLKAAHHLPPPTRPAKAGRSNGCGSWPRARTWIRPSPRSC